MNQSAPSQRWLVPILLLLGLSVFINYIDRGNLSTAAPLIKSEFRLSASQLGFLLTSFFITYTVMQPLIGWLVDHLKPSRILLAGFTVWSLATILSGLASSFAALFALRLLLGMGEAVAFPASWAIICRCFDESRRGFANAALLASMAFGPAFGVLLGGLLIASYGWRPFFIGFGIVSLVWILPWLAVAPKCEWKRDEAVARPSYRAIVKIPWLWGASLGHAGATYAWYFILTWIPYYLMASRHWPMSSMAIITAGAYSLCAIGNMASGWIADRWIATGTPPTLARKSFMTGGLICTSIAIPGCLIPDARASIACLMLAGLALGTCQSNIWAAMQTIAGTHAIGRWTAIQNTVGSMSGIVAPTVTGLLVDRTGSFVMPFAVTSAMAVVGAAAWVFLVGPVVAIDWSAGVQKVQPLWNKPSRVRSIR